VENSSNLIDNGDKSFFQDSPNYQGVLASCADFRLAISPNGKRYLLQVPGSGGLYKNKSWRNNLAKLIPDLPAGLLSVASELPDDPAFVPRPWDKRITAQAARVLAARFDSDSYSGSVFLHGSVRVVITPDKSAYIVQVRSSDRWHKVASVDRASRLPVALRSAGASALLLESVWSLPDDPSDYRGKLPELLADVLAVAADPRRRSPSRLAKSRGVSRSARSLPDGFVPDGWKV
jgi:hypothetical protein